MYLGIGCGTQSTKALLIDEFGKVVGRGSSPHPLVERPSGAREQEPKWWIGFSVIPQFCRSDDFLVGVENNQSVLLTAHTDCTDTRGMALNRLHH